MILVGVDQGWDMAQFLSDFVSYTTAAVAVAAILSANIGPEPDEAADSVANAPLIEIVEPPSVAGLMDTVPEADLIAVTFASQDDIPAPEPPADAVGTGDVFGRVTGQSVNIRSGPGTRFPIVARAGFDERFGVTGRTDGNWVEITGADAGERMWIHGNFFEAEEALVLLAGNG